MQHFRVFCFLQISTSKADPGFREHAVWTLVTPHESRIPGSCTEYMIILLSIIIVICCNKYYWNAGLKYTFSIYCFLFFFPKMKILYSVFVICVLNYAHYTVFPSHCICSYILLGLLAYWSSE